MSRPRNGIRMPPSTSAETWKRNARFPTVPGICPACGLEGALQYVALKMGATKPVCKACLQRIRDRRKQGVSSWEQVRSNTKLWTKSRQVYAKLEELGFDFNRVRTEADKIVDPTWMLSSKTQKKREYQDGQNCCMEPQPAQVGKWMSAKRPPRRYWPGMPTNRCTNIPKRYKDDDGKSSPRKSDTSQVDIQSKSWVVMWEMYGNSSYF